MNQEQPKTFDFRHGVEIFENDADLLREIVELFLKETPAELEALESAAEGGAIEDIITISHRLAGSSAMIGALRLSGLARALEMKAKEEDITEAGDDALRIKEEFENFRGAAGSFDWDAGK